MVQKSGVLGITGCLEHGNMKKAKTNEKDLDVIWLDLANAYRSVPHQMILLSLRMYHIPEEISKMQRTYFDGFLIWLTTKEYTTKNRLEVGIAIGCLVSPILFILTMQFLLKVTENLAEIVELGGGLQMLPVKAFMDDATILSSKETTTCKIQSLMDKQMIWCRMKFKPKKAISLSLRKRKVNQNGRRSKNPHRVRRTGEKFETLV